MTDDHLELYARVYNSTTDEERRSSYAAWAPTYEASQAENQWRAPEMAAGLLHRHVVGDHAGFGTPDSKGLRILDVGAGTGLVGAAWRALEPSGKIVAYDLSPDMLKIAREKKVYDGFIEGRAEEVVAGVKGEVFAGVSCVGSINVGHFGIEVLDEFIKVVAPLGCVVVTLRSVVYNDLGGRDFVLKGQAEGKWRVLEMYLTRRAVADDTHVHVCVQRPGTDEQSS